MIGQSPILITPEILLIAIIIAIIGGVLYFIIDLYNESKTKEIHGSLIAGISVTYFFLIILPNIGENMPEYPLHLEIFEYLFILIGFTFIHISEKYILQRVDHRAQIRIRQLVKMEKSLDIVESSIGDALKEQLYQKNVDQYAIKDLARVLSDLIEQEVNLKEQDYDLKCRIQDHINEDLDNIHQFTNYAFHFLIGLIFFNLLLIDIFPAILFFCFAFFKAIISKTSNDIVIFPDIPVHDELKNPKPLTYFLCTAALTGTFIGIILQFTIPISLEIIYILFSFISGVILYIIVREVIPEKEKGNPLYFLIGVIGFTVIILIIRILGYTFLT